MIAFNSIHDTNSLAPPPIHSEMSIFFLFVLDIPTSKWSQCQFCKLVITTVNLWRHIRTQHTAQPPRQCDRCQKKFKNKYSLREHVRIAHEQRPATTSATSNTTNVASKVKI